MWSPPQNLYKSGLIIEKIRQIPTEEHPVVYLIGTSQNCQGQQKQGGSKKLSQPRVA